MLGQKHFTLMPPVEAACINEQAIPAAKYAPRKGDDGALAEEEDLHNLRVDLAEPVRSVHWALWDPDEPAVRPTEFSSLARPLKVTLDPGDMLYLPALWCALAAFYRVCLWGLIVSCRYHKVAQSCSEEGVCCAVNYW